TVASGAVEDDRLPAVRRRLLDPRFEKAARHVDRAGDPALAPLVLLADVDDERTLDGVERLAGAGDVDLLDLALDLLQQLAIARHDFHKCSDGRPGYAESRDERPGANPDDGRARGRSRRRGDRRRHAAPDPWREQRHEGAARCAAAQP